MNDLKEKILDLDIVEAIGRYITLKNAGANYKGNCPFHGEKTPSLMVSPSKNMWKCFGCGKGGNLIDFVMEHESLEFMDAMKKIAGTYNIEYEKREYTEEERKADKHKESILVANKLAAGWFSSQLLHPENTKPLEYVSSRWNDDSIKLWGIGFAPDSWDGLINFAKDNGIKNEILLEAGLIKEGKNGKLYDFFRNRIIFPIHDRFGRIIAFTGRDFSGKDDVPKYMNTPETDIYTKGNSFYGWFQALKTIRKKEFVYLVEGNPDVIRMHEIGEENTIGTNGTALTREQVDLLKKYVKCVNIIGDSDRAGKMAMERSAKLLIEAGLQVNIVQLPDEGKEDPDSFFTTAEKFKEYVTGNNIVDYIILKAKNWAKKANNPDFKSKAIDELSNLIVNYDDPSIHEIYIEQLARIITPKKAWTDKVRMLQKEKTPKETGFAIPDNVKLSDWEKFGFYEDHGCYYFKTKSGVQKGCNFIMKPLFHVQSVNNAKRLYEIKNEHGHIEVIELLQKDLVALARFKERVESLGNFLWEGSETDLNKLKRYLYEKTETCVEITQLGWQGPGFFAWANGIYNGEFKKVDEHGIVSHEEKNWYLPAFSSIYKGEEGLFMSERRFIHREQSDITLNDYTKMLMDVFGDNAIVAVCFYMASLFRDHIVRINNFFPILNLFGPKGAGKTELAVSILQFFGRMPKGPNINNTTKAALADHVAQVANSCVHIDEYKNSIEYEKIEFLKGLWDGTGRTRMNMDKDKKKETTAVDCGIILSGQEMPTADIALFSRLVYLSFYKCEYSDQEKVLFNKLKEIEKKGLTHITHQLLAYRKEFIEKYRDHMDIVTEELSHALNGEMIEARIFNNWMLILSAYSVLADKIKLPFTRDKLMQLAANQLRIQNRETKKSNEISTFWTLVQYMYADGHIQEDVDFKIDHMIMELKTDLVNVKWDEAKNVIYVQHSRIIPLYRKHGKMMGEKILPADSIDYYLRNDKRFLGKKTVRFKAIDPKTGVELITPGTQKPKSKITSAYAFLYDDLGITLKTDDDDDPDVRSVTEQITGTDDRYEKTRNGVPF